MLLFIEDLKVQGKRVLMRVDFNVPLDSEGAILDASRIEATLPSIRYVIEHGGKLILMSHLGRPRGEQNPEFSLSPCAKALSRILGKSVSMAPDCRGEKVREMVEKVQEGGVLVLENLRFHRAEEYPSEDPSFASELASFGDLYINDAFSCSHRKHSSIYSLPLLMSGRAACGYQLAKEISILKGLLTNPERPFYALIGGAKVSSKIGILKSFIEKVDALLIGGAMAFTFLKAKGLNVGRSLVENDLLGSAKEILEIAKNKNIPIILPIDTVAAPTMSEDAKPLILSLEKDLPEDLMGLDIGPSTLALFEKELRKAKTIFWNGPMGVYEMTPFSKGTLELASVLASLKAKTIVGGGDSIAAIHQSDLEDKFTHLSTGGGATLEFIEKGTLPGIEVLSEKEAAEVN